MLAAVLDAAWADVLEGVLDVELDVGAAVDDATPEVEAEAEVLELAGGDATVAAGLPPRPPSNLLANKVAPTRAPAPTMEAATTPTKARRRERSASSLTDSSSYASSYQYGSSSTITVECTNARGQS